MKKWLLILSLSGFCYSSVAQNPLVKQWDKRFGADETDNLTSIISTSDGGFLLGGHSWSGANGDKTEVGSGMNSADYWVVKTDSIGNKIWDRTICGNFSERLSMLLQTADEGFILAGSSFSDSLCDKTFPSWGINGNTYDYWIVKLDSAGNTLWDHSYGGNAQDELYSIQQTTDGGYILGGYSHSDSSGDKSQNSQGGSDYWMIKVDSTGNKLWDKTYGGTNADLMKYVQQTPDGGYILGGFSKSELSGDKSESSFDTSANGNYRGDYWILKTDASGNKLWDKAYGGANIDEMTCILNTPGDNGYILSGYSKSGISGIKTQPSWGGFDYWLIKTDSLGNLLWERSYGGTDDDYGFSIWGSIEKGSLAIDHDGGFIMGGASESPVSGDKTEANLGARQSWFVKTDSLGNKSWDKTIFTDDIDVNGFLITIPQKCYAVANNTKSGIGGYKTQPSWGFNDYWMVVFCDTLESTGINEANDAAVLIFPNPFTDMLNLSLQGNGDLISRIKIFDLPGKLVYDNPMPGATQIWLGMLPAGMYIMEVQTGKNNSCFKILKQ